MSVCWTTLAQYNHCSCRLSGSQSVNIIVIAIAIAITIHCHCYRCLVPLSVSSGCLVFSHVQVVSDHPDTAPDEVPANDPLVDVDDVDTNGAADGTCTGLRV